MQKEKNTFIKIPKEVIMRSIDCPEKLLVYCYVYMNKSINNSIKFTINDILKTYSITRGHNGYQKVQKEIIDTVEEYGVENPLNYLDQKENMRNSKLYTVHINDKYFHAKEGFAVIKAQEWTNIVTTSNEVSIQKILIFLAFYRINMLRRDTMMHDSIEFKPETWYFYTSKLCKTLNISEPTCRKIIKILEDMDIIRSSRLPSFMKNIGTDTKQWHSGYLILTNYNKDESVWRQEIEYGIKYANKNLRKAHKQLEDIKNGGI